MTHHITASRLRIHYVQVDIAWIDRPRLAQGLDVDAAVAGGGEVVKPPSNRERDKMRKAFREFAKRTGQPPHSWLKSKDKARLKEGKRAL